MAVSPSDFALYSRVTGRPVPTDRGSRMKMAPEVSRFIRNREYERPQKTALQKGADLLGKAAMIGGTLAAAHAIGGGFKGKTGENVGKVADVVQNLAKTGVVGAEGGDSGLDFVISGGSPVSYGQPPTSGGNIDLGGVDNTILPSQPEVSAQIESPRQKVDSWLATNAAKYRLSGEETGQLLDEARQANAIASEGSDIAPPTSYDANVENYPLNYEGERRNVWGVPQFTWETDAKKLKLSSEDKKRLSGGLDSAQRQARYSDTGQYPGEMEDMWENRMFDAMARDTDPPNDGGGGGGGPLAPVAPQPTEIVTTTPESSEMTSNEGGIRQKAEELGNNIEAHVKKWYHLDNEKIGYQLQGALENENPLAGAAQAAGVIVPALGKQGLLNAGQTAQGLYGYGKEFMGDYVDTVRQGYERAKDIALSDQIRRSSMGVGGGKVLGGDFSVSGSPLSYGLQNQIDQGWSRHDATIAPLAKNLQAAFGITLPTGQVSIGENHQLTRIPKLQPSDTTIQVPSRAIQQFSDKSISGEGSLTPGDRSDLQALLSGSSAALGPDETVGGDIEIRTDIDVDDPVLSKNLYGRRVGRGEKQKFITGLKARNEDVYSGEGTSGMRRGSSSLLNPVTGEVKGSSPDYETYFGSDAHVYRQDVADELRQKYQDGSILRSYKKGQETRLPQRKEGTGIDFATGKRVAGGGSIGQAVTVGGIDADKTRGILYTSPDDRPTNVFQDVSRTIRDEYERLDQEDAAEEVGRRMAEREEQGSTEWVRSPDGKLRRKKIDDPWDS